VKYALDTNIFIAAFREPAAETALLQFLERALPFTFLSAVVMQELAAGARTVVHARELDRAVFRPFVRRGRVFAPTSDAFIESGRLLSAIAAREGWPIVRSNPSLLNDTLLAASCRERGITLITQDRDFDRMARLMKGWRPVAPWPDLTR
jgi:predicted nucleic acid-binding protein